MSKLKSRKLLISAGVILLIVAALSLFWYYSAGAQSFTQVVNLLRGQTAQVTCDGANRLRMDRVSPLIAILSCGAPEQPTAIPTDIPTAVPTAIPTDVPTAAPTEAATATPVPPPSDMTDMTWHAPGAHGDRTAHEHGDAPPAWLLASYGYTDPAQMMLFTHAGSTPGENMLNYKHTAFKGWEGQFQTASGPVRWFAVLHLDTNPVGQAGRYHSYQLWALDPSNNISHWSGWLDFGTGNNTGSQKIVTCGQDSGIRPIILVNQAGCAPRFENWYARAGASGAWAPDFGFNINPTYYDIGSGDPLNTNDWRPINEFPANLDRRIEWAWYAGRSSIRGGFWATQFGEVVSGPGDPVCGTTRTIGTRTYTVACIEQYIAPTMPEVSFNTTALPARNSVQRTFPGGGIVRLPN